MNFFKIFGFKIGRAIKSRVRRSHLLLIIEYLVDHVYMGMHAYMKADAAI